MGFMNHRGPKPLFFRWAHRSEAGEDTATVRPRAQSIKVPALTHPESPTPDRGAMLTGSHAPGGQETSDSAL